MEARNGAFAIGVQWHPEMFADTDGPTGRLFAAFLDAAAGHRRGSLVTG